jgi:hypothetical protein
MRMTMGQPYSLRERVARRYFPERFPLALFGEPHRRKVAWLAQRAARERELAQVFHDKKWISG